MHPRDASLPTGENAPRGKPCGILGIRAGETQGAAVNRIPTRSWGRNVMAPRHGFEPRFTAPKAAVLPLDDRGVIEDERHCQCSSAAERNATAALAGRAAAPCSARRPANRPVAPASLCGVRSPLS